MGSVLSSPPVSIIISPPYAYDASLGLNGNIFTVEVIDANRFKLVGVDKKDYNAYPGGGQIIINPKAISSIVAPKNQVQLVIPSHGMADGERVLVEDIAQPADFNDKEYVVEVVDDSIIELVGTNTSGVSAYSSGGTAQISHAGVTWEDTVTDGALEQEEYKYKADNYATAPKAKFAEYVKNRLWLFGVEGQSQKAFFSEEIGGDGGTPLEHAVAYPQKYSSWFKDTYSVTCSSEGGQIETGMMSLTDDLYFFFEERIFGLFGSDPVYSSPVIIAPDVGLAFPDTLVRTNVPYFGGMCLLFMSNRGPAVIKQGGEVRLVTEFKIAELWPDSSTELYGDLFTSAETKLHIHRNCTAMFWKDTWTVAYKNFAGVNKIWEMYFDPDYHRNPEAPHGAYQIEMASV